jgi:hypothetical protein
VPSPELAGPTCRPLGRQPIFKILVYTSQANLDPILNLILYSPAGRCPVLREFADKAAKYGKEPESRTNGSLSPPNPGVVQEGR